MSLDLLKSILLFKKEKENLSKSEKKAVSKTLNKRASEGFEKVVDRIEKIGKNINNY